MPTNNNYFQFIKSDTKKTQVQLISLLDDRTNYTTRTVLSNASLRTPSITAFAGARYSRSASTAEEIFTEISGNTKDANERLSTIFRSYGHASVADMAQLFVYIENVPQIIESKFFNETSVGGGQGRSTRFQNFGSSTEKGLDKCILNLSIDIKNGSEYISLNEKFIDLQRTSTNYYLKYVDLLSQAYQRVYEVDLNDKKQASALQSRVFDTARYFLLSGINNVTSFCWITSAREWARIISFLKSSNSKNINYLAQELETLLAPEEELAKKIDYVAEAPDLIRYTQADETNINNLKKLKDELTNLEFQKIAKYYKNVGNNIQKVNLLNKSITSGSKILAQSILSIYPNVEYNWLLNWIEELSDKVKIKLSEILFCNLDHHNQANGSFRVNTHTFVINCSFAEFRDLNRHRAWGRFCPYVSVEENQYSLFDNGYVLPLYLSQNEKLTIEREMFEQDLKTYYQKLEEFKNICSKLSWFPENLFIELLPFAHNVNLWFHASPKEISYLTKLRVRPGGHINYREIAYLIAQEISKADPLLSSMNITKEEKPNASSKFEFLNRS
jgi:thymidylate synthase ThyX